MEENKQNGLITKWGDEVFDDGVMNAPQCVAKYGYRLLTGGEFSFVMCLLSYKYDHRNPFPSQKQIAKDMGVDIRQVERWVNSLFVKKGLIEIYERSLENGTRTSNEYNFGPLLQKCLELSKQEKEKGPKVIKKKVRKREIQEQETQQEIHPTKSTGDETYPEQNVRADDDKMYGRETTECTDGLRQNVRANKEREKQENINQEISKSSSSKKEEPKPKKIDDDERFNLLITHHNRSINTYEFLKDRMTKSNAKKIILLIDKKNLMYNDTILDTTFKNFASYSEQTKVSRVAPCFVEFLSNEIDVWLSQQSYRDDRLREYDARMHSEYGGGYEEYNDDSDLPF